MGKADVTADFQEHLDEAAKQLSKRTGKESQFSVQYVDKSYAITGNCEVHLDIIVYGISTWTWVLSRKEMKYGTTPYAQQLELQEGSLEGRDAVVTSMHSEIVPALRADWRGFAGWVS